MNKGIVNVTYKSIVDYSFLLPLVGIWLCDVVIAIAPSCIFCFSELLVCYGSSCHSLDNLRQEYLVFCAFTKPPN